MSFITTKHSVLSGSSPGVGSVVRISTSAAPLSRLPRISAVATLARNTATVLPRQQQQQLYVADSPGEPTGGPSCICQMQGTPNAPALNARISSSSSKVTCKPPPQQQQRCNLLSATPVAVESLLWLCTAGNAAAAKIEVEVPDFLVEAHPIDALLHSPVLAVGAAVLALVLLPKLIKTTINYIFYPAIVALAVYLAVSHPEATANSLYYFLEFIRDHPAASSVCIIAAAGVLLGPDVLAGAAVAGVLLLLAAQAGLLQLPQLPKLPGHSVVTHQLTKAKRTVQQKIEALDDDRLLLPAVTSSQQQQQPQLPSGGAVHATQQQQQQGLQSGPMHALKDVSSKVGTASKQLLQAAKEALPNSEQMQAYSDRTIDGLQAYTQDLRARVQVLGDKVKQAGVPSKVQEMRNRVQGLGDEIRQSGLSPRVQELSDKVQELGERYQHSGLNHRVQELSDRVQASQFKSRAQVLAEQVRAAAAGAVGQIQQAAEGVQGQAEGTTLPVTKLAVPKVSLPQLPGVNIAQGTASQLQLQQPHSSMGRGVEGAGSQEQAAAVLTTDGDVVKHIDSILENS